AQVMAMSRSPLLASTLVFGALLLLALPQAFLQPAPQATFRGTAAVSAVAAGALLAPVPAFAGEPPSVGEHWYWNLGIGQLHGETASIIFLVFGLLVIFSLLGMGGSSRKASS
ncbi:unnamed protein product, partial [Polarella glacialis]